MVSAVGRHVVGVLGMWMVMAQAAAAGTATDAPQMVCECTPSCRGVKSLQEVLGGEEKYTSIRCENADGDFTQDLGFNDKLTSLEIDCGTDLAGDLPDDFDKRLPNLRILVLRSCPKLRGNMPPTFSNMQKLESFTMSQARLQGTLAGVFNQKMPNLEEIDLQDTMIGGELTNNLWANMPSLKVLRINESGLSGRLDTMKVGSVPHLKNFNVSENDNLEGTLPLDALKHVEYINVLYTSVCGLMPEGLMPEGPIRIPDTLPKCKTTIAPTTAPTTSNTTSPTATPSMYPTSYILSPTTMSSFAPTRSPSSPSMTTVPVKDSNPLNESTVHLILQVSLTCLFVVSAAARLGLEIRKH